MTVGFGFSIAGSTLVGQHLGAKDPEAASRSGWRSLWFAVISMGSLGLLIVIFAQQLARYFIGDDAITITYTVQFIYLLGAMMPLLAVEFAIGGSLRGAGDTRFPLIASAWPVGYALRLAAVAVYLELAVFWCMPPWLETTFKGALLIWRFRKGKWKKIVPNQSYA